MIKFTYIEQFDLQADEDLEKWEDFLAPAPWNRRGNDARKRKGFGELMLKQIVKESKAKGYGGRIVAISSPDAKKFYLRFGFTPDESREDKMVLKPKAAKRFLNS